MKKILMSLIFTAAERADIVNALRYSALRYDRHGSTGDAARVWTVADKAARVSGVEMPKRDA